MGVPDDVGKVAVLAGSSASDFMAGETMILDDGPFSPSFETIVLLSKGETPYHSQYEHPDKQLVVGSLDARIMI